MNAMKSTIDAAGRVVVPKRMREELGMTGGTEIEIDVREGVVEIRPTNKEITLGVGADGRPVLKAPPGTPPMTDADVLRMIDESRRWPRD